MELLAEHWVSLVFGLISAGALAYAKYISSKFKEYKRLASEEKQDKMDERVKVLMQPLQDRLTVDSQYFESIKQYFRFVIIEESERLLHQGHMSTQEYQRLNETFKVYHGIGGNSQAQEYYERTIKLPIYDDEKKGED